MALLIPYLVRGFENFLPEGLIFPLSRDLPLEGENFPAAPVKTVLLIPKLVRKNIKKWRSQGIVLRCPCKHPPKRESLVQV